MPDDPNELLKTAMAWDEDAKEAKRLVEQGAGTSELLDTAIQFKMNAVAKAMLANGIAPLPDALLKVAEGSRNKALVKPLLAAGIDVNATDEFGKTALQMVIHHKKRAFAEALVAAGAEIDKQMTALPHDTALHLVCETASGEMTDAEEANARWLIEAGANPNIINANEYTALHLAVKSATPNVVAALVAAGAQLDLGSTKFTPLVLADRRGDAEVIAALG